jgi:hypothetical protein
MPPPGLLARCCPDARTFTVLGDPINRLVAGYRLAVLQDDPTAAGCGSLADYIEQNSSGVTAADRTVRMLCDPRPIASSRDWRIDTGHVDLAYERLTRELNGCFLLEQPLLDLELGQWLRLPGGCLSLREVSGFTTFNAVIGRGNRSAEELEALLRSIHISENCLALARQRNPHDVELYHRLVSHQGL